MSKNPLLNAGVAIVYIILVASVMYYGPQLAGPIDGVIVPIALLSLFVLSAVVMGFLFLYEPMQLYFSGEKKEAIRILVKTIAIFGSITILLLLTLFSLNTAV